MLKTNIINDNRLVELSVHRYKRLTDENDNFFFFFFTSSFQLQVDQEGMHDHMQVHAMLRICHSVHYAQQT